MNADLIASRGIIVSLWSDKNVFDVSCSFITDTDKGKDNGWLFVAACFTY